MNTKPDAQTKAQTNAQTNRPTLEGITLEVMVTQLSESIGWETMAEAVSVRCFVNDPSVKSSLTFLRRTPWARQKVEELYLRLQRGKK
jgi:uncharacterized protein (DUF2132 family)